MGHYCCAEVGGNVCASGDGVCCFVDSRVVEESISVSVCCIDWWGDYIEEVCRVQFIQIESAKDEESCNCF